MSETTRGRLLPSASVRTQLLLAALTWTAMGVVLPAEGIAWGLRGYGLAGILLAAPFLLVGLLKAKLLDRVTNDIVRHIRERGDHAHVLGFFPLRTWLLVPVMMAVGAGLRHVLVGAQSRAWLGFVYVSVGSALLISSRNLWRSRGEQSA